MSVSWNTGRLAALLLAGLLLMSAAGCGKKEADGGSVPESSASDGDSTAEDVSVSGEAVDKKYSMSNFVSLDLDKNKVNQSYFRDYTLTLVFVWSPNSEPCMKMLPEIVEFANEQKDEGIGVLGILAAGASNDDEIERTKEITQLAGATFLNLLPTEELYEAKLSEVKEVPYLFCVDYRGAVVGEDYKGFRTKADLQTIIGFRLKEMK